MYSSKNIIMVNKSQWMRWMGHVACIEMINVYKVSVRKHKVKNYLGDLGKDGRLILKWI
jgi:hypothetical protein